MNRKLAWRLLQIHFGVIAALAVIALLMIISANPDDGACIGCGFPLLGLYALGLPWSVASWVLAGSDVGDMKALLLPLVPAVLNLVLHAAYAARRDP